MNSLTAEILAALENSGRTLSEFLRSLDEGDSAAFDFLNTLIDEVIVLYEED